MADHQNKEDEFFAGNASKEDYSEEECPICEMMRFEEEWDKWEREMRAFENSEDLDRGKD